MDTRGCSDPALGLCTSILPFYWYISQVSGERLQDHWSSGLSYSPCHSSYVFSDVVRLCSLEYIEGDCKPTRVSTGKSSSTRYDACACNEDFCNGTTTPVAKLLMTFGLIFGIFILSKVMH